jgi:hypothetical protein
MRPDLGMLDLYSQNRATQFRGVPREEAQRVHGAVRIAQRLREITRNPGHAA